MTSSTPSPSAAELADFQNMLAGAVGLTKDWNEKCRQSAALLRRLSDTERERDEARALLDAEMLRCPDTSALTCARAWGVPPRWAMHHIDTDKARAAAEAERDQLREMLAQADAVIDAAMSVVFGKDLPMPGDPTRVSEALSRHHHRLSQKG